jgi:hypothetical protein
MQKMKEVCKPLKSWRNIKFKSTIAPEVCLSERGGFIAPWTLLWAPSLPLVPVAVLGNVNTPLRITLFQNNWTNKPKQSLTALILILLTKKVDLQGLIFICNEKTKRLPSRDLCYRKPALRKTEQKLGFAVVSQTWAYRSVSFIGSWTEIAQAEPVRKVAGY